MSKINQYCTLEQAQAWARSEGIRFMKEWQARARLSNWPDDIPRNPRIFYGNNFPGYPKFLGLHPRNGKNRTWMPYYLAKEFIQSLGLLNVTEFREAFKREEIPPSIPRNPDREYKVLGSWESWPIFLGFARLTGVSTPEVVLALELSNFTKIIRNTLIPSNGKQRKNVDILLVDEMVVIEYDGRRFHNDQKDLATNKLLQAHGWKVIRVREAPLNILSEDDLIINVKTPAYPMVCSVVRKLRALGYLREVKNEEIEEYLNRGKLLTSVKELQSAYFRESYPKARDFARSLHLKSFAEWLRYAKENELPRGIPKHPEDVYKNDGFTYSDWLGTVKRKIILPEKRISFDEARIFARETGIKTCLEWRRRIPELPPHICNNPETAYKSEFKGWEDFLGTGFCEYEKARSWARSSGARSQKEWKAMVKAGMIPIDIPRAPWLVYKDEWVSLADFLNSQNHYIKPEQWLPFEDVRRWVQSVGITSAEEWKRWARDKSLPFGIPSSVHTVYESEWNGWPHFFGRAALKVRNIKN